MYSYEERIRAVDLYIKYDMSIATTIRELGYPSRGMLYNWYKEYKENVKLRKDDEVGYSKTKYTSEQQKQVTDEQKAENEPELLHSASSPHLSISQISMILPFIRTNMYASKRLPYCSFFLFLSLSGSIVSKKIGKIGVRRQFVTLRMV